MSNLLIVPNPRLNESMRGFFQRTVDINKYKETLWLYELVGWKKYNKTMNLIFPTQIYDFTTVVDILRRDEVELKSMILAYRITSRYDFIPNKMQQFFRQFCSSLHRPRICPLCVNETDTHNIFWELSLFVSCPIHKCLLIDECERCSQIINPIKINITKCECGFEYHKSKIRRVEGLFSNYLQDVLSNRARSLECEMLNQLSNENLIYLLLYSVRWSNGKLGRKMHSLSSQPLKSGQLYEVCEKAINLYENWPSNFYRFIDDIRILKHTKNVSGKIQIKRMLLENFDELDGFDYFRNTVEEYFEPYWKSGFVHRESADRSMLFPKKKKEVKGLSGKEVAKILGVDIGQIRGIVEKGILPSKPGLMVFGITSFCIDAKDVYELLEKIEDNLNTKEIRKESVLSFSKAAELMYNYDINLADFILLLKLGDLTPCKINEDEVGLSRFCFNKEEIEKRRLGNYLVSREISIDMNVKLGSVHGWIKQGFIKVSETKTRGTRLILLTDFLEFRENYIPAVEVVRSGVIKFKSTEKLLRELKKYNIFPVNQKECQDDLYLLKKTKELDRFILINKKINVDECSVFIPEI